MAIRFTEVGLVIRHTGLHTKRKLDSLSAKLLFSKLIKTFVGYFDPENTFLGNVFFFPWVTKSILWLTRSTACLER